MGGSAFFAGVFAGVGVTIWLLVMPFHQDYEEIQTEAVEQGYGRWCVDRSFVWQHEECE